MHLRKANQLIHEKSPYLLQHAFNPVAWLPWGEQAFAKARQENKPIFLSIGYSTCHWCHVMERESFEEETTARLLNEYFVPVKVDREERPDIDALYMSVVTAMTGSGGWPMSVFLTPEQKPFYAGTYFPPQARFGSPGFKDLLWSIHNNWKAQEDKIRGSADSITQAVRQHNDEEGQDAPPDQQVLERAYDELRQNFDPVNGGFGSSPKFPMGHSLSFLLRHWKNTGETAAREMLELTLRKMALGGICDQLGGGFHRYSTDATWQVPHFEKMLYDQALLSKVYLETYQATRDVFWADVSRDILDYVLRDLCDAQGGFYCAQDADSLEFDNGGGKYEVGIVKREGAFYLWPDEEIRNILNYEEYAVAGYLYDLQPNGNTRVDPHGEFVGNNILHGICSLEQAAGHLRISVDQLKQRLASAKQKLFKRRTLRPYPHLDDKVLADWNGLMISSLAMAGRILDEPRYLDAAKSAAGFILEKMSATNGGLWHRYRDGESGVVAGLDDYAFIVQGLLDIFENSFEPEYLEQAVRLTREMVIRFWDEARGGFYLTDRAVQDVIFRPKEVYDGACPSGNSVAALNLMRLYHLTSDPQYVSKAQEVFKVFGRQVAARPSAFTCFLNALQFYYGPVKQVLFAGDPRSAQGADMMKVIDETYLPQRILIVKEVHSQQRIEQLVPLSKGQSARGSSPRVYVCHNQTCHLPVQDTRELRRILL